MEKLKYSDLAFHVTNAFCYATVNSGVGGIPKIAVISKSGAKIPNREEICTLTNLAGAYISEFNREQTAPRKVRNYIKLILEGEMKNVTENIAQDLDLNVSSLTSTCIPYSSWQERANHQMYD